MDRNVTPEHTVDHRYTLNRPRLRPIPYIPQPLTQSRLAELITNLAGCRPEHVAGNLNGTLNYLAAYVEQLESARAVTS